MENNLIYVIKYLKKCFCKKSKREQYIIRNEKSIIELKLAFFGATKNFYLLEEQLVKNENINLYQYGNYLCQIALCIELGLKSIIIDKYNVEKTHDLKKLFKKTSVEFQDDFRKLYNELKYEQNIANSKFLFVYLRYLEIKYLKIYMDKENINNDNTINLIKVLDQPNIKFLQDFLDVIIKYQKNKRMEILKAMSNNKPLLDDNLFIKQYIETLDKI